MKPWEQVFEQNDPPAPVIPAKRQAPRDEDHTHIQALADKCGQMMVWFIVNGDGLKETDRAQRLEKLSAKIDQLHAELDRFDLALEAFGWTVSAGGHWHRVGEPPPPPQEPISPEALLELARSQGFPGLFAYGRYVGSGEKTWTRFVQGVHPMWRPVAEVALLDYVYQHLQQQKAAA